MTPTGSAPTGEVEDDVLGSLGNRIFIDDGAGTGAPNDGIQSGAEAGVRDVVVDLYQASQTPGVDTSIATNYTNTFFGCALTQTSVDNILASLVVSGRTNGSINLTGGTTSTPSAAGLASKATLLSRGWTVTHN